MNFKNIPLGWRKGQAIWSFIQWLLAQDKDIFYLDNEQLERFWNEYWESRK